MKKEERKEFGLYTLFYMHLIFPEVYLVFVGLSWGLKADNEKATDHRLFLIQILVYGCCIFLPLVLPFLGFRYLYFRLKKKIFVTWHHGCVMFGMGIAALILSLVIHSKMLHA